MLNTTTNHWPAYITNNQIGVLKSVDVEGARTAYAVVDGEAFASVAPQGFVGCHPNTQFFFISDEVPESYQELFIAHEVYEYALDGGPDGRGNCLKALHHELTLIPENIREEYLTYRRNFFQRMADFYEGQTDFLTRRNNILESLHHIETLV